jgi:hypothetical protein
MTHEECIGLVAEPEHVHILCNAAKYADVSATEAYMRVRVPGPFMGVRPAAPRINQSVYLHMRTHAGKNPPLRPLTPTWQGADKPGADKLIAWIDKQLALSLRFAVANHVLDFLYHNCDSGSQVRYLWPVCMHLVSGCEEGSREDVWAKKFAEYKPQKHLPVVPPATRMAIRDSSALITSAVRIGEEGTTVTSEEVSAALTSLPTVDYHGLLISLA